MCRGGSFRLALPSFFIADLTPRQGLSTCPLLMLRPLGF